MEDGSEEKERKPGEVTAANLLVASKMAELQRLKEKLKKAKDDAVQSWLDSRPLIDELEKLQSELADSKTKTATSNTTISDLESQLETLSISTRAKKEEELKIRTMINRINQVLQETQEEMEQIKIERNEKHRERLKQKQVLRLRRQTLRTLQLTLRAIRLESEAYAASVDEAKHYINLSQTDDSTVVKLTQEEYHSLAKRARDETSLADWRVAVSVEQKKAAEESQETADRRLKNLYSKNGSKRRKHQADDGVSSNPNVAAEGEEQEQPNVTNGNNSLPKTRVNKSSERKPQKRFKKLKGRNKYLSKKKKSSTFCGIRTLVLRIKRYFK
ncbi:hypothetical protein ACH5RR_014091 [Cinchona calisaya]|uniref:Uncharacterized protein n=1 Tax=Cinchona calisaya TaxID=153742 RepID=A0ABD3A1W7_9GENT